MRRKVIGLVISILLISSLTLGCFQDSNGKEKNKKPTANAGEDFEVLSLTEIHFDGTNSDDPDGKIVSYAWEFGDYKNPEGDDTSSKAEPRYTYNYPGEYTVTLTITDDDGATATDTIMVTVKNRKPLVETAEEITAKTYEVICFNVTASDFDGYITSFEWDFDGDDEIDWFAASKGSTTHFYDTPGVYKASLIVTDNSEAVTKVYINLTILEIVKYPPKANAGLDQTIPTGDILLIGTGLDQDGSIVLYEWDFDGDGEFDWSSDSTGMVDHNYTKEGEFTAKFRVTDDTELTASDSVIITVNNSYFAHNVSATIYFDWNTSYDYIILLNNSIDSSHLIIIISDIATDKQEEFHKSDMKEISSIRFRLSSTIVPVPNNAIQVQVLYYKTLIGARVLDIVNQSVEFLSPEQDFEAVYNLDQEGEEKNSGELETLRISSIGEVEIKKKGDLFYTSFYGTGVYYALDEFEDGQSETTLNCTEVYMNYTYSGSNIVSESISLLGHGTMITNYEEELIINLDIKKMRLAIENDVQIENYMYGEGTFTGQITDPELGLSINLYGDVYFYSELIGHGTKKNWEDKEFPCNITYTDMTIDGEGSVPGGTTAVQMQSNMKNTTWNVDSGKYSNTTIYYEYEMVTIMGNQEIYDSGTGNPDDHPSVKEAKIHISDALEFETPRPRVLQGEDLLVMESKHGVKLQLTVLGEVEVKIDNKNYECVDIRGEVIEGASGTILIRMITSGNFAGMEVFTIEDYKWKDEWMRSKIELKYIRS